MAHPDGAPTAVPTLPPLPALRVLEVGGLGPVPFAGMLLADLGADVVRIQRVGEPGHGPVLEQDPLHRNKRVAESDLADPEAHTATLQLVERADILIEGFRPGVMERLGLGPEVCLQHNPRLVYGRLTGWGQTGPRAHTAGHDLNYIAITGALHAIGRSGQPPSVPLNLLGDFAGGSLYLVVGILTALLHARETGVGQVIDASIVDGVTHMLSSVHANRALGTWSDDRGTNLLDSGAPYYDVYQTSDGHWLSVACIEDRFFEEFRALLGLKMTVEERSDRSRWPELRAQIQRAISSRALAEWEDLFDGSDACVAPVRPLSEAPGDSQLMDRRAHVTVANVTQGASAPRFSGSTPRAPAAPRRTSLGHLVTEWAADPNRPSQ